MKDAHGHLHDAIGRFARTGAMKKIRDPESRRGKSASVIRKHITESQAYEKYIEVTNGPLMARNAYRRHERGEDVQGQARHLIFDQVRYGGPRTKLKTRREAVIDAARRARRSFTPYLRHTTKRTASGKAYVERGYGFFFDAQGNEHVHKPKNPKRNLAGKKGTGKRRIIDIRTPGKHGRHSKTAREMMRGH